MHVKLNPKLVCNRIFIGYSGGIDSHVLLHWCATHPDLKNKMTAVHVDHGLQAEAGQWSRHCAGICDELGINFFGLKVDARHAKGDSPEQAARVARYAALRPIIGEHDYLLLAQHREDQLETFLLQLFRGSGPKGLSAMPESMDFGQGTLLRPMLDVSKAEITRYAHAHGLRWIEDPSNQSVDFDRNFLRNQMLPLLKQRWPGLDKTVARSAQLCAEQGGVIGAVSQQCLDKVREGEKLNLALLADYTAPYRMLIVRSWLEERGLKMPSEKLLNQILNQALEAKQDAGILVTLQGHEIRRYRRFLYCLKTEPLLIIPPTKWHQEEPVLSVTASICYQKTNASQGILEEHWRKSDVEVRFRQGGETLKLPGRLGRRDLKDLFQEAGLPPWERSRIPLVFLDGHLAAVGDLWISADFFTEAENRCVRILRL
jgi:tRNA(Ile)-lysidine synthase